MNAQLNYLIARHRSAELQRAGRHARPADEAHTRGARIAGAEPDQHRERASRANKSARHHHTPGRARDRKRTMEKAVVIVVSAELASLHA